MHAIHCIFATEMNTSGGKTISLFLFIQFMIICADYCCKLEEFEYE